MSHTINIVDIAEQDVLHRVLLDMQSHGAAYSLVQDGVEVAKLAPVKKERDGTKQNKVSDEIITQRRKALEKIKEFSKEVARVWNTGENAVEVVINNRR